VGRRTRAGVGASALVVVVGAIVSSPAQPAGMLKGTYRVTLAARDLRAVGASSEDTAHDVGTWTLILAGGRWTLRQTHGLYGNGFVGGVFAVEGSRAAFTLTSADGYPHGEFVGTLRWRTRAGVLRFATVDRPLTDLLALLIARPWKQLR
jgi:hypothetical protein